MSYPKDLREPSNHESQDLSHSKRFKVKKVEKWKELWPASLRCMQSRKIKTSSKLPPMSPPRFLLVSRKTNPCKISNRGENINVVTFHKNADLKKLPVIEYDVEKSTYFSLQNPCTGSQILLVNRVQLTGKEQILHWLQSASRQSYRPGTKKNTAK